MLFIIFFDIILNKRRLKINIKEQFEKLNQLKKELNLIELNLKEKILKLSKLKGFNWKLRNIKNLSLENDLVFFVIYDNIYSFKLNEIEKIE